MWSLGEVGTGSVKRAMVKSREARKEISSSVLTHCATLAKSLNFLKQKWRGKTLLCPPCMAVGKLKVRNRLCIGEGFVDYANVRIIANIVIHHLLFLGLSTTLRDSMRVCLGLATLCLSSHSTGTPLAPHHQGVAWSPPSWSAESKAGH